jgi:hypothetical protein
MEIHDITDDEFLSSIKINKPLHAAVFIFLLEITKPCGLLYSFQELLEIIDFGQAQSCRLVIAVVILSGMLLQCCRKKDRIFTAFRNIRNFGQYIFIRLIRFYRLGFNTRGF